MSSGNSRKYVRANEEAWDEVTPIHQSYRRDQADFFRRGGVTLDKYERQNLPALKGSKVAHLCCNCGQDTLSLVNLGAECTGFDLSGNAISEAKKLSEESGIDADFVKADVLNVPVRYHNSFDLVYISIGVLVWIPDIELLMKNASHLLRDGGELFIYDQHPFVHLFESGEENELNLKFNYFEKDPQENSGLDYIGDSEYESKPNYQFMVRISDLLNGIAGNGMVLTKFLEFKHSIEDARPSDVFQSSDEKRKYLMPHSSIMPNTMMIRAVKKKGHCFNDAH